MMRVTQDSDSASDSVAPGPPPPPPSLKPFPDSTPDPASCVVADAAPAINSPEPSCPSDDESHGSKTGTGSFYTSRAAEGDPDSGIDSDEEDELPELTEGSSSPSCARNLDAVQAPNRASSKSFGGTTGAIPRCLISPLNYHNPLFLSAPPNSLSGSREVTPPGSPLASGSDYWPPKMADPAVSFSRAPGAEIRGMLGARPPLNQTPLGVNSRGFPVAPPFFLSILLGIRDPFWQEYVARPINAARAFTQAIDEDPSRPYINVQGERYLPPLTKVFRQAFLS